MVNPYNFLAVLLSLTLPMTGAVAPKRKPVARTVTVVGIKLSRVDAATKAGLQHLYNLEYDAAISDFEHALTDHPADPFAVNHLAQAILLKELYRLNALDTTLYADNGFLTGKPLPGDPAVKQRLWELIDRAVNVSEQRLEANDRDADAYYARGVARGLRLSWVAMVEKSFWPALRNASGSRNDHEKVLEIDPNYTDAKLVVGVHNFVLGSMPVAAKVLAGVVGIHGSKDKGLQFLREVGACTECETSADARVALSLFLRREAKYQDALEVQRSLIVQYPKNFLFALEEANLLKDIGNGPEAAVAYTRLLDNTRQGQYIDPHIERATFGLAEVLKGQRQTEAALKRYQETLTVPNTHPDLRLRALLGTGQMQDVLKQRPAALESYRAVLGIDGDSPQAAAARRYLKEPYSYPR